MNRVESVILFFLCAAAIALAVPLDTYASIELDEEEVVFRLEDSGAAKVFLAGDFNNWNPKMDSMVKRGGAWELRLYLVPGRYRYMFVVDGENVPDPDNPNRDGDGNTFFIFVEEEGTYSIIYEVTEAGERKIEENYTPYGALSAVTLYDYSLFTASTGMKGEIDGNLRGDILVGFEYEPTAFNPVKAYLFRAKGEWVTDKFQLGAFHRSGRVGFDDPLSLFTDVGPYAYPLDLFCRGVEASAGWKNSIAGRVFFANRIDGYESALDWIPVRFNRIRPNKANPWDKDMIGVSIKGVFESIHLEYLYRHDRGPYEDNRWVGGTTVTGNHGIRDSHGLLLELRKKDYPVFRAQYLSGRTRIEAGSAHSFPDGEPYPTPSDFNLDLEDGYRALVDISYSRGAFSGLLGWHRTTIERNSSLLAPQQWASAMMDFFEARAGYETESLNIDLGIGLDDFSGEGGTGRTFWLQAFNFWLDGDALRTEMFQFLESHRVWKAEILFEEKGEDQIPGPYRLEGYISASTRWDNHTDRGNFEITGGKGIRVGSYLSFHTDLRYVSYNDDRWTMENSFLDVWLGMRASVGGAGWVAWGMGVAPHRFDKWYFDFTGDGREAYLLGEYLLPGASYTNSWLIDSFGRAEKSLSENWNFSFEGGFSF